MIKFTIGGRLVDPRNMEDALMAAFLEGIRTEITEKIGAIRDPETNEFPTVIVRGDSSENLTVHVEGTPELVSLVRKRLGMDSEDDNETVLPNSSPRVFLSYTSDNLDFATKMAEALEASGIKTWWDQWCIYPGDSLRQKIDEGIADCTHFLVLLTPESIEKPWVNQEMDAGLIRKLNDQCRFLPVRFGLPAQSLPPLLSGMNCPEIKADEDIAQLIADIYGVNRRPPRGAPPVAVERSADTETGYSPAATTIVRLFVKRTEHALFADPRFDISDLANETGLSVEDTKDALYELNGFVRVSRDDVLVQGTLFAEFDRHWKPWDPDADALQLAADLISDPDFPDDCKQIADRYGWEPRRLNPVIHYLLERGLIVKLMAMGTRPWAMTRIVRNDHMRRFVKSRT